MNNEKNLEIHNFDDIQTLDIKSKIAGIFAHDINNFLVPIAGNISLAKVLLGSDNKAITKLEQAEKACEMLNNYTTRLNSFAKAQKPTFKEESISRILKNSLAIFMQNEKTNRELHIVENLSTAEIDHTLIKEVITNLLKNANAAIENEGTIKISGENFIVDNLSGISLKKGNYVKITIEDDGSGIPPEKLVDIFNQNFKIKQGFGILLSNYIIKKHDGHFSIKSQPGKGTTCTIYLPVKQNNTNK